METYDVAIIGGGPAGSTVARMIGAKYRVLLLERRLLDRQPSNGFQKCCGGLLDPDAQNILAEFGLGLPKSVIASPQMFAVRAMDLDNSIERYYQRHYVNVYREGFDKWIQSLVPDGVEIVNGSLYRSHILEDDHIRILYSHSGEDKEIQAKIIIGADGANSAVRRHSFETIEMPKVYAAVQEWFENTARINYYGAIFDSKVTDFYSWLIPKDNCLIVGSALDPDDSPHDKFLLLKRKLEEYGFELNKSLKRNGSYLLRPQSVKQINNGSGRIALVGEAAGFISPSSAEGFSYAFRSAIALADSLLQDFIHWEKLYRKRTWRLRQNIQFKILKSPFMYNKILRELVMRSGLKKVTVR